MTNDDVSHTCCTVEEMTLDDVAAIVDVPAILEVICSVDDIIIVVDA